MAFMTGRKSRKRHNRRLFPQQWKKGRHGMKTLNGTKIGGSACILFTLILLGHLAPAAEGTWTYKANMPTRRLMTGGGVVDGRIYVLGGAPSNFSLTAAVEMYDPGSDSWTRMADMPSGRCGPATCTIDGKIYVFGGVHPSPYSGATKSVYIYDPQTDSWTRKQDMPFPNAWCGIAVVDGIVYLIGGMHSVSSAPFSTVMAYDPATESWAEKAAMPTARGALSACVVDGRIYAIGGAREDWTAFSYKRVEVYDPSTDTWTRKADMPTPRWGLGTCVVEGKIYAVGGRLGGDVCAANEVYDPMTDTWTAEAPMQQKRNGACVCSIEDKIYAIGGVYIVPQETFLAVVEEYDTGLGVPSADLNADFVVDIEDLILLIEHWEQSDPRFDIAPPPFGDGVTNVTDLEYLMSLWGQEVDDPTLMAHWKLDETEGMIACDSAGAHDGTAVGNTMWQPSDGVVGGALELDGTTFVVADSVLNPEQGPFSVFAWVKGGAPGQAIISQQAGYDWLVLDPGTGAIMTELRSGGRQSKVLCSDTVITDGAWHRVGFTWDGSNRRLYVDDILVAEDTDVALAACDGGVNIGCGKTMTADTFFTGLIDDVRIYNRAVKP